MNVKRPIVHKKIWGEEHWIVNREYCGKVLVLKKGYQCSLHFHKDKDETFFVESGSVLMELNYETTILHPGDIVHVAKHDKHTFTGLQDSRIIEFSTHHEDSDSYRITQSCKIDM